MLEKYTHKEIWARKGNNFSIEVVRWAIMSEEQLEETRSKYHFNVGRFVWNIYFYLHPGHPLFDKAEKEDMFECPLDSFHGGCTFAFWYRNVDGAPTCKQYGCDYNHYMDDRFQRAKSPNEATEVFADAEALFNELEGTQNETI